MGEKGKILMIFHKIFNFFQYFWSNFEVDFGAPVIITNLWKKFEIFMTLPLSGLPHNFWPCMSMYRRDDLCSKIIIWDQNVRFLNTKVVSTCWFQLSSLSSSFTTFSIDDIEKASKLLDWSKLQIVI